MPDPLSLNVSYYTLTEISEKIRDVLNTSFTNAYWVKAEIAKLNLHTKTGHCFPELVEKLDGRTLSRAKSVIWANDFPRISKHFIQVTREVLRDGMTILALIRIKYDPLYGLTFQIIDIDPSFTLGSMAREKQEAIERLKEEGFFERNKLLKAPLVLNNLAVISVESGKGYHDFINIINQFHDRYTIRHKLFSAVLQGDHAVPSIIRQLSSILRGKILYDAVLIIRGGGDELDLSCYDKFDLAREIALFPIPVITGIGHSTNITVCEMVAHQNKITPTDVAYHIISTITAFDTRLDKSRSSLLLHSRRIIAADNQRISELAKGLKSMTTLMIRSEQERIDVRKRFEISCRQFLKEGGIHLHTLRKMTSVYTMQILKEQKKEVQVISDKIRLLDPKLLLKRGYTISRVVGKIVISAEELKEGEIMETEFYKGKVISRIEKISKTNHGKD